MGSTQAWREHVFVSLLGMHLVLGIGVSVTSVFPQSLSGFDTWIWVVLLPASWLFGLILSLAAWFVSFWTFGVLAILAPRVSRVAAISIAITIPAILAIVIYPPWEQHNGHGLLPGSIALPVALTIALVTAVFVVRHAERAYPFRLGDEPTLAVRIETE